MDDGAKAPLRTRLHVSCSPPRNYMVRSHRCRSACSRNISLGDLLRLRWCRYCTKRPCEHAKSLRCKKCNRRARIAAKYGLWSRDLFELVYRIFHNRCGICSARHNFRIDRDGRVVKFHLGVDHIHSPGNDDPRNAAANYAIRGILCNVCNVLVDLPLCELRRRHRTGDLSHEKHSKVRAPTTPTLPLFFIFSFFLLYRI